MIFFLVSFVSYRKLHAVLLRLFGIVVYEHLHFPNLTYGRTVPLSRPYKTSHRHSRLRKCKVAISGVKWLASAISPGLVSLLTSSLRASLYLELPATVLEWILLLTLSTLWSKFSLWKQQEIVKIWMWVKVNITENCK